MQLRSALLRLFVLGLFSVGYAAVPQNPPTPKTRPAPGGGSPGGNRPGRPGGGSPGGNRPGGPGGGNSGGNNRPQPGRPNPGGPQIQPVRPGPGNRPRPPRPNPGTRPPVRPPNRPGFGRPPQWGRPPGNRPSYGFRPGDRAWLHRYYGRNLGYINLATRPRFAIGGFFPFAYIPFITPLPAHVYGYLPPPPPGYQMGYYDGYVVVYDPVTYFIANVVDLMDQ